MANNPNDPKFEPAHSPQSTREKGASGPKRRPEDAELPDSVPFGAMSDGSSSDSIPFDELPVMPPSAGLSDPELYLSDPKHREPRVTPESAIFENMKSPPDSSLFDNLKPDSDESLFGARASRLVEGLIGRRLRTGSTGPPGIGPGSAGCRS